MKAIPSAPPQTPRAVLTLRGIRKAYPGVVALDGVDLELRAGEVHVLLGENGAGKSTLMKIISGAVARDAGEVLLDGAPVEIRGPRHAQALGLGIIYQEFNLIPHLTAGENIFLGREPRLIAGVIDQGALLRAAQKILDELGVAIDARSVVSRLSVAQQQMVEVAKALSLNARVLMMDEPTSALTEQEIRELFATIARLKARGVALVYISHRMEELFVIGDRVTVLRDGRHVGTRSIGETTMAELVRLMVGRDLKDQFPKQAAPVGDEALRVAGLRRNGVLHDINFTLRQGEVVGLAGLMGSGRTELARAVFGADPIDGGRIFVGGRERQIGSPRAAIGLGQAGCNLEQGGFSRAITSNHHHKLPLGTVEGEIPKQLPPIPAGQGMAPSQLLNPQAHRFVPPGSETPGSLSRPKAKATSNSKAVVSLRSTGSRPNCRAMAIKARKSTAPSTTAPRAQGIDFGRSTDSPTITMPRPRISEPIPMVTSAKPW